ncbi:MAG TPA: efflux RND transporter permease subunit [Pirellulales bacterium]|jgi:Cu(I)/Ag(I) efflux system membrane protein CusA/SilA|nr:efflux RND transporter permease subunit [Pirellulales bacterium]
MIGKIIELSIRNRLVVILLSLGVIVWGVYSVYNTPVDAIPDLSENQVIIFTDWMGRSPREIEDQITYPLSVNLQGLAGVKTVRSSSEFNFSMINIIFEDNVDYYFARERVLERLTLAGTFLPPGVVPYLAPDATALGQIFWYTVAGEGYDAGRLRAIQDWYVRYQLNSVAGVAQVASVGGFPIEYQIDVDPNKLRAYGVTLGELYAAVARSNSAVGGRVVQKANAEYLIRGVGWLGARPGQETVDHRDVLADIENTVIKSDPQTGTPIRVAEIGAVGLGTQFRRSVLESNGGEAVGGVVMMRYGENPLAVTKRIKQKIEQLQPGLPPGVRIVPFYDRTRLIEGAIHTLAEILTHETIIASIAVLLILMHFRSALVICVTLPLAVLISFILMRTFGIASNIMSLSGIAISIGVLVDQAIVMVENATHHLTEHFHGKKISGDIRELVIPACRTVGRPIFFSVVIILISFIPVFTLGGQEGKTFHPLAFTKSFAMIGVALISITLVPALIPTFLKGRLRREEENWLVRSLIRIYQPVLAWAMNFPKVVNWFFIVLLALGFYLAPKIGREYMPPLDEGSILDMPVTVPRASVTESGDDLRARDAILREFPEVEQVVGKAGRAETPTDPAPLDMIETIVNLRPQVFWPKRQLKYADARKQTSRVWQTLVANGFARQPATEQEQTALIETATMTAATRLDTLLREFLMRRYRDAQSELAVALTRLAIVHLTDCWRDSGELLEAVSAAEIDAWAAEFAEKFGVEFAAGPAQQDVNQFVQQLAERLSQQGKVRLAPALYRWPRTPLAVALAQVGEVLGSEPATFFTAFRQFLQTERDQRWLRLATNWDYEVFDQAVGDYDWLSIEELEKGAVAAGFWTGRGTSGALAPQKDAPPTRASSPELQSLRAELDGPFARRLLLWKKSKPDLVKEMDSTLQMPGWGNIWTQPIINRIDMLATGVRTMIGVKVFGPDLNQIQAVSEQLAAQLRTIPGAADVFADQNVGKGYLEITVDRARAARYGISVGDIQDVIEVALGGKPITTTVEGRERHPVRIRYARAFREDEESIKNLLIHTSEVPATAAAGAMRAMAAGASEPKAPTAAGALPIQVPLAAVADVRIVEGPSMIKSENGLLRSYVQLNVRDRDIVGFVEEAQRVVAHKLALPPGMYLEWTGQFEHQVRARKTLMIVVPAVVLLIFIILYLTYHDLMDALLMMMAVPEALVGGIFFLWLTGFNFSVAVWIGFIACFGMATETGIIMLVYLREAIDRHGGLEQIASLEELRKIVIEGAVHRLRPKLLTEGVAIVALAPMLWASGVGHEVISAMAAPVLGGLLISDDVVDLFIPVRFFWVRRARWLKLHASPLPADSLETVARD